MIRSAMTFAAAGLLAGCTAATAPQTVARLGADPVLSGGSYDSGGGITVAIDLRERDGRTMVCGVWAESRQQSILTNNKAKGVLDTGAVAVGGKTVLQGLRFMKEVPPMADYGGQETHCAVTSRTWQAGDAARRAEIRIPRQVVHVEDDEFGGTFAVRFRQTGPGAGGA
ncbi:hypothetical protein [Roseovarius nitratireducens]|uniref:hypothetical protein n=1 Tax=Roseovarius nitratireducens TaxID=2044597 RepID=UPI000CE1B92D|nr:hypothetical protein [Roseovarius nitratireducens]